ncbi:GEVED domain-containing protein [Chryseobacterium gwangjuense]|uniref:GEVED domain-containing protein n=1 Tax=Chryseobacterium gwangjuense TaxID=1069980 RepID=UPI001E2E1583|nr:GEVED domain-containing protein [Chryseobacterium gwangjuense]MCE3076395.1 GEVED domain-containing protein [Chryseobacterium gwangjuense]
MKKNLLLFMLFFSFLHIFGNSLKSDSNETNILTIPTNVAASNITFSSAQISWNAIPGSTQFTIKIREQGTVTWMLFPVFNLNAQGITALSACTTYEVQVMENLTGDTSESIFFTTQPTYCTSSSQASGGWLLKVQVVPSQGGFPMMTSSSGASTYSNYRNDPLRKITLLSGSLNNYFNFTTGYNSLNSFHHSYVKAWIDFNGNGLFETQEVIVDVNTPICCQAIPFNVPGSVISDIQCSVVMRVINSQIPINSACGNFSSGEVEDYAVYFSKGSELGTDDMVSKSETAIFPNPVADLLHFSNLSADVDFEMYNVAGQLVNEGRTKNKTVNVSHLIKGVYFIQIKEKENSVKLKFIKK